MTHDREKMDKPMKIAKITLFLLLLLSPAMVFSTGRALSLSDALLKGLENNFQVRISRRNLEIAQNNDSWGAAGRYPTIDLTLNSTNRYSDASGTTDPDTRDKAATHILTPGINLRWVLFNGFAVKIAKDKLAYLNNLSQGNAALVVENTVQAIVLAYYKALLEKEKLQVIGKVKKLSKDRYDYVMARKEIGIAVTYDVLQAKLAFLNDTSNFLLQQWNYQNALRNLNLVLGEAAEKEYELTDDFAVRDHQYDLADLIKKMVANNKTLQNQYINQAILKKEISLQKSYLLPSLTLNSGITRADTRYKPASLPTLVSDSYDYYVNFSLGFNLFNGGNTRRAIANARIREKIGALQSRELELTLENRLLSTFELYKARRQLFAVAEESVESAALSMSISDEKFRSGAINSFNYRDVQLVYQNAAISRLQAVYSLVESHTELTRLTGSIVSEY